ESIKWEIIQVKKGTKNSISVLWHVAYFFRRLLSWACRSFDSFNHSLSLSSSVLKPCGAWFDGFDWRGGRGRGFSVRSGAGSVARMDSEILPDSSSMFNIFTFTSSPIFKKSLISLT